MNNFDFIEKEINNLGKSSQTEAVYVPKNSEYKLMKAPGCSHRSNLTRVDSAPFLGPQENAMKFCLFRFTPLRLILQTSTSFLLQDVSMGTFCLNCVTSFLGWKNEEI